MKYYPNLKVKNITVIKQVKTEANQRAKWLVRCDCGLEFEIFSGDLSRKKSCVNCNQNRKIKYQINQIFGKYKIINKLKNTKDRHANFELYCSECKLTFQATTSQLNQKIYNCNCYKENLIDLSKTTIGKLYVIKRAGQYKKNNHIYYQWLCFCTICKKECIIDQNLLRMKNRYACGNCWPEGEDHKGYKKDRDHRSRLAWDYKKFCYQVHKKYKFKCVICGINKYLNVHHLNGWSWCISGRFDLNNVVTLCRKHHNLFHKIYGRKNNTKEQFDCYLRLYHNKKLEDIL